LAAPPAERFGSFAGRAQGAISGVAKGALI